MFSNRKLDFLISIKEYLPVLLFILFLILVIFISTKQRIQNTVLINPTKALSPDKEVISNKRNDSNITSVSPVNDKSNPSFQDIGALILKETKQSIKKIFALSSKIDFEKILKVIIPLKENRVSSNKTVKKDHLSENIIRFFKETSIDTNRIAEFLLTIFILTYESIIRLVGIYLKNFGYRKDRETSYFKKDKKSSALDQKSDKELRKMLEDVELIKNLNRSQLIDLLTSNQSFAKRLALEEREKELLKKTNLELRKMLEGVGNISRLKKKELVKKILSIED
ncbi:hypothetical protein [Prochlorococcus sp. MIT 0603]|uniref:hypothetical protein n=1 Tax=unclassified Prochlorococcus TaxID=2627481 RepID=UPI001268ADCA